MKINKIYFKNINSFKGEHRIDFTENPIAIAGLFAIVGPTGAGKSTILDAITLALFNQIPRFDKKMSKESVAKDGSILTRGERECAVEVEFTCKSGSFVSKWWIEMNRNQNLNDYGMEITDLQTDLLLPLKKSEVPKKNEELIGLSYDQFNKSILLSQGEFAKFLKSGKDERGKLLEDITGTQIYRKLGKKAYDIAKEKTQELTNLRTNIKTEQAKLSTPEDEQIWLNRKLKIEKLLKSLSSQLEVFKTKIDLKNRLQELQKNIEEKVVKQGKEQQNLVNFEQNEAKKLQVHEKAEPFQQAILQNQHQEGELKKLKERLKIQEDLLAQNEGFLAEILTKIGALTKEKLEIKPQNALEILQGFREKINQLEKQKSEQEGTKKANENQIIDLVKVTDQSLKFDVLQLSDEIIDQIKNTGIAHKNTLDEAFSLAQIKNLDEIQAKRESLTFEHRNYNELKNAVIEYTRLNLELQKEKDREKEQNEFIVKQKPEIEKVQLLIVEIEKKITNLEAEKERLSKSFNLEKDRQNLLKKDEPCPLCGSLEHPFLSHYANNYVEIDLKLTETKNELKSKNKAFTDLNSLLVSSETTAKNATLKMQSLEKPLADILTNIKSIKKDLGIEKVGNKETIEAQLKVIETQQKALDGLEEKNQKLNDLRRLHDLAKTTNKLQNEYNLLVFKLNSLYNGNNFEIECNEIQTSFSKIQANIQSSTKTIKDLKEEILPKQKIFDTEKITLEKLIKDKGFEDLLTCQQAILTSENATVLREKKQALLIAIQTLSEQIKEHQIELTKKQENDDVSVDLDTILLQQTDSIENQTALNAEQVKVEVNLVAQNKTKQVILGFETELVNLEKYNLKWELLTQYIGDATGKKFSTFAQGLTLSRLIALANRRLKDLSDRYLLDKPTENEDDELMIVDLYMGNEKRSVKTLSGGETFMISLSLALALSDLASKNIKLESLFIDEGFGTLDPETLDLALNTLEKLQQEGQKNIGIISHVESIKERIATQIRLERNNRGFSQITIV